MRRKSARNAAKASPEKVKKESPTRKSRRQSKRRKRSTSESSDDSQDEKPLKQIPLQETPEPVKSHSPSDEENVTAEQPVWKVTPANTSTGEIQKLKICLTRPSPSTPERTERSSRRHRNRSGDDSPEEKPRRTWFRGSEESSTQEDEKNSEIEEREERRGKGKSKGKHKSKVEKTAQLSEAETEMQSEISANVQVTLQSPSEHSMPVDNDESVDENVPAQNNNAEREEIINDESKIISENAERVQKSDEIQINEVNTSTQEENETNESEQSTRELSPENEQSESKNTPEEPEVAVNETVPREVSMEAKQAASEEMETDNTQQESNTPKKEAEEEPSILLTSNIEISKTEVAEAIQEDSVSLEAPNVEISEPEKVETDQEVVREDSGDLQATNIDIPKPEAEEVQQKQATTEISVSDADKDSQEQANMVTSEPEAKEAPQEQTTEISKPEADDVPQEEITPEIPKPESPEAQTNAEPESVQPEEEAVDDSIEKASIAATLGSEIEERSEILEVPTEALVDEQCETSEDVQETRENESGEMSLSKDEILGCEGDKEIEKSPQEEKTTANTSFVEQMDVDISESEHFKNLEEELKTTEEPPKIEKTPYKRLKPEEKKRKWGTGSTGLKTIFSNILKIDLESVKELCPDLKFLEEDEVKLEAMAPRERKKSVDQKVSSRKVSIDELETPTLKTQTSVNSTNSEPVSEQDDNSNIIALNRKISIVDDTASKLKPPPSPAKNPVSAVLYITNLVRPFTLKQLKELLERTGKIQEDGFWTDRIKSKCYVHYESIEEAEATRNALHGVQWPIGNGKKLIIEYSTPEDMEVARNPPAPAPIVEAKIPDKENAAPIAAEKPEEQRAEDRRDRRKKEMQVREWDIGKEDLHRDKSRSRSRERNDKRKHVHRSHTPIEDFISKKQRKLEESVPQKLMDDLFQKTKATPCIYWQPLTPEEIAMKQQQRLMRMAEHKRRMEETSRNRGNEFNRGAPYRRRHVPG